MTDRQMSGAPVNEQRSGAAVVNTSVRLCEWRELNCYSYFIEFLSSICYNVLAHKDNQKYDRVLLHIIYTQIQEAFCKIKEV